MMKTDTAIEPTRRARQDGPARGAQGVRPTMLGIAGPCPTAAHPVPTWRPAPRSPNAVAHRLAITVVLVALAAVILALAGPRFLERSIAGCRNTPARLIFGETFDVTMSLGRNTACSVWLRPGSAFVDELDVTAEPRHGTLGMRGRTGVIYRADRNFTGEDYFSFVMRGQSAMYRGTSVVRVRVVVR